MGRLSVAPACALALAWTPLAVGDFVSNVWTNYSDEASVVALAQVGWSASSERNTIRPEPSWSVEDMVLPDGGLKIARVEWIGVRDPRYDYDADFIMLASVPDPDSGGWMPDQSNQIVMSDLEFEAQELQLVNARTQIYRGVLDFSDSPIDVLGTQIYVGTRLVGVTDGGGPNDGMNAVAVSAISDSETTFGGLTQAYFRGVSWGFPSWSPINLLFGSPEDAYELAYKVVFVPEPGSGLAALIGGMLVGLRRMRSRD